MAAANAAAITTGRRTVGSRRAKAIPAATATAVPANTAALTFTVTAVAASTSITAPARRARVIPAVRVTSSIARVAVNIDTTRSGFAPQASSSAANTVGSRATANTPGATPRRPRRTDRAIRAVSCATTTTGSSPVKKCWLLPRAVTASTAALSRKLLLLKANRPSRWPRPGTTGCSAAQRTAVAWYSPKS